MTHKPIQLSNLSLSFPHKTCFDDFTADIHYSDRIAIIGRNGSGKSTLLKMLQGLKLQTYGNINIPTALTMGYVPQIIEDYSSLSGAERFQEALTKALCNNPNCLILDEPTNHLDSSNRQALLRMLDNYPGTLIIVTHDVDLLERITDQFWHIDNSKIHIFKGHYSDYVSENKIKRGSIEHELYALNRQKKESHKALMQEQHRAAKSRQKGKKSIRQNKWPTIVSDAKAHRAEKTTGRKKEKINEKKCVLQEKLSELRLPKIITPKFSLNATDLGCNSVVSITEGSVGYSKDKILIDEINIQLIQGGHLAITGNNGSGKTTLIKAIMNHSIIIKSGTWLTPKINDIGYLDQHYSTLDNDKSVFQTLLDCTPDWSDSQIRQHLSDFLFFTNETVFAKVATLSGGEKARLSLALIAAQTPRLLLLDEITNNLDIETRDHVIQVLRAYPGSLIVISHDEHFLKDINISNRHELSKKNSS